jgi:uncharacterized protein (TIGR03000 family)
MYPFLLLTALSLGQTNGAEPARVTVLLPSEARLYVHGRLCDLTSDTRSFDTPPLQPGRDYYYVLKAAIERDGRTIEVSKKVLLRAGKRTVVDFGDLSGKETASTPDPEQPASRGDSHLVPRGSAPMLSVARMEGDTLLLMGVVAKTVFETRQKTVKDPEGKERAVTYTVTRAVFEWVNERVDPKTVQVLDAEGKTVAAERLPERLPRAAVVLVGVPGQKTNPMYRGIFDKDTLLLVRPPHPVMAPPPPPPPAAKGTEALPAPQPQPAMPAQGPPPRLFLARLDNQGNLHIRFCAEETYSPSDAKAVPYGAAYRTPHTDRRTFVSAQLPPEPAPKSATNPVRSTLVRMMVREIPADQIKVYDSDGLTVAAEELKRLLREEKVVLAAMDGKQVDPFYLRNLKKGTLILVPSAEHQILFTNPLALDRYGYGYSAPAPMMPAPSAPPGVPITPRPAPPAKATPVPVPIPAAPPPVKEPAPPPAAPAAPPPVDAQQPPAPRGDPFQVFRASAAEKDGSVIVQVTPLQALPQQRLVDGKPQTFMVWRFAATKPLVLGKQVRAFRPDGKPAEAAEVLKALARPTGVACFMHFGTGAPVEPDPFFLALLREGSVALVVDSAELFPPRPQPRTNDTPPKKGP